MDARGINVPSRATPLWSLAGGVNSSLGANTLADTNASFSPGSLIGMKLNPNSLQNQTFTVVSNSATVLVTDPLEGDMRSVAVIGSAYHAQFAIGHFGVQGGAMVELADVDLARADRRGWLHAGTVAILGSSLLTHPAATMVSQFGLELSVDDKLTVETNSRVDVTARGYLGGRSGDNIGEAGLTLDNSTVNGSSRRNGASYGGSGAFGNAGGTINSIYGMWENPNDPGSGGGSDNSPGGSGGGLIRIAANNLLLEGQILANGRNGSTYAGGGSGGGIKLNVGTLAGGGSIAANGGGAGSLSGGGGGGRIAIYYTDASTFSIGNVAVASGVGSASGVNGTIFLLQTNYVPQFGPQGSQLFIASMKKNGGSPALRSTPGQSAPSQWILECVGPAGAKVVPQLSPNLKDWHDAPGTVEEVSPGYYRVILLDSVPDAGFFRLRLEPDPATATQPGTVPTAPSGGSTSSTNPSGCRRADISPRLMPREISPPTLPTNQR